MARAQSYVTPGAKLVAEMKPAIDFWKQEEFKFYERCMEFVRNYHAEDTGDILESYYLPSFKEFPSFLYRIWFEGYSDEGEPTFMNEKDFRELIAQLAPNANIMQKGDIFEQLGVAQLEDGTVLREMLDMMGLEGEAVGKKKLREDVSLTKIVSLDFKYSEQRGIERFNNIIKPYGSQLYSDVRSIEESIMRSVYKYGKDEGRLMGTGATAHPGIFQFGYDDNEPTYREVTIEERQARSSSSNITDYNKKILIFYFTDNAYWASELLQKVVDWAAQRLDSGDFKLPNRRLGEKTMFTQAQFWNWEDK